MVRVLVKQQTWHQDGKHPPQKYGPPPIPIPWEPESVCNKLSLVWLSPGSSEQKGRGLLPPPPPPVCTAQPEHGMIKQEGTGKPQKVSHTHTIVGEVCYVWSIASV